VHVQDVVLSNLTAGLSMTMPPTPGPDNLPHASFALSSTLIIPSIPNQPPLETHPALFIAAEQPHDERTVKNRVFNYYFLFLALLTGVLAVLLWWLHRQRRREREQIRLRGQRALAQDVERWAVERRNQAYLVEGLDETGEAPPPYQPKGDNLTSHDPVTGNLALAVDVTPPPRALSREETEHARPPEYAGTIHVVDCPNVGSMRSSA
jgi:hypothetical protein